MRAWIIDNALADESYLAIVEEEIRATGASAIIVTHSAAAAATADRVLLLSRDGLIAA